MARQLVFIGVTTGQSSIVPIFPRWRDCLGLGADVELAGWDVPIHAPPERYRTLVRTLKDDDTILGALVTTHKLDLYAAAHDLLDEVDHFANLCREVSCLARRNGRLLAWAKDPISAGRTLATMLGPDYFARTGGRVLCFGAGGAGLAIILYLLTAPEPGDRPAGIVVADRNPERLAALRALHRTLAADISVDYVEGADPARHDSLVGSSPPGSLVINATGMGKDTPGSPITDRARFPEGGIAWELNYRGALDFLHQARAQRESRALRVEDGWRYFILGWTTVIEEVFERPISPDELEALAREAAFARPPLPTTQEG